ncbi:hypothetical protein IW261DRAFT_187285 [Armillaria novae-zelandiae]|uniref:Uncharacterized protein n=1 Tax=Armillaria novae-zelandiae TaxID=153914 RepID=A0AA39P7N8_9AGAR|nr:hypothetical protein IW261DRAFT_187285 [Armillaria novae-zelandiae]
MQSPKTAGTASSNMEVEIDLADLCSSATKIMTQSVITAQWICATGTEIPSFSLKQQGNVPSEEIFSSSKMQSIRSVFTNVSVRIDGKRWKKVGSHPPIAPLLSLESALNHIHHLHVMLKCHEIIVLRRGRCFSLIAVSKKVNNQSPVLHVRYSPNSPCYGTEQTLGLTDRDAIVSLNDGFSPKQTLPVVCGCFHTCDIWKMMHENILRVLLGLMS